MSLESQFARPEEGFDPTQNQIVLEMYPDEMMRATLDPKGQRAPTVQERIDTAIGDFERLIGRPPDSDEEKRLEDIQIRCSGWLEGLIIDLEGKKEVPVEWFNRLIEEQDNLILYVARDRVHADALYIQRCMERDDEIKRLGKELEDTRKSLDDCTEPQHESHRKAANLELLLDNARTENQEMRNELDKLKSRTTSNLDLQLETIALEVDKIKELEQYIQVLEGELGQSTADTKDVSKSKAENKRLEKQINDLKSQIENPEGPHPETKEDGSKRNQNELKRLVHELKKKFDDKNRELNEVTLHKIAELEARFAQNLEAEISKKKAEVKQAIAKSHESATLFSKRKEEVDAELTEKEKQLAALRKQLSNCQRHGTTTQTELDELKKQLQDCQTQKGADAEKKNMGDAKFERQLQERGNELGEVQDKLNACYKHNKSTQDKIDELEEELRRSKIEKLPSDQADESMTTRTMGSVVEGLEAKIRDLEAKIQELEVFTGGKALEIKGQKSDPSKEVIGDELARVKKIETLRDTMSKLEDKVKQGNVLERELNALIRSQGAGSPALPPTPPRPQTHYASRQSCKQHHKRVIKIATEALDELRKAKEEREEQIAKITNFKCC